MLGRSVCLHCIHNTYLYIYVCVCVCLYIYYISGVVYSVEELSGALRGFSSKCVCVRRRYMRVYTYVYATAAPLLPDFLFQMLML